MFVWILFAHSWILFAHVWEVGAVAFQMVCSSPLAAAMNYVNFGKGLRGVSGIRAAGINYGNVEYFPPAVAHTLCLVKMMMMMITVGN